MKLFKRCNWTLSLCLLAAVTTLIGLSAPESWGHRSWRHRCADDDDDAIPFAEASLFFELNNTDGDLGIHSSIDGDAWSELEIEAPNGRELLDIQAKSRLRRQGLTQLFFESAEPPFDELAPRRFFRRFPPGEYEIEAELLDGGEMESVVVLTHLLPAPPTNILVQDMPSAENCDAEELPVADLSMPVVISWDAVTRSHPELGETNEPIDVALYQLIVEREEPSKLIFSVDLPPERTEFTVPEDLLRLGDEFKFEIIVREESGNQTAVESCFKIENENENEIELCFETTENLDACDPEKADFTLESMNAYYPLIVGSVVVLEGEEDGDIVRVERTVLEETMEIEGVETRILEHKNFINGEIHEIAHNFYVEASDGTVCYFGEDVEFYEDGELVSTAGTWRVGVNDAKPGIIMPARPMVGQRYFQEFDEGSAMDMARIEATGLTVTLGDATFEDVVRVQDSNPIDDEEPCVDEEKLYTPGIGEIKDVDLEIVSFTPGN